MFNYKKVRSLKKEVEGLKEYNRQLERDNQIQARQIGELESVMTRTQLLKTKSYKEITRICDSYGIPTRDTYKSDLIKDIISEENDLKKLT